MDGEGRKEEEKRRIERFSRVDSIVLVRDALSPLLLLLSICLRLFQFSFSVALLFSSLSLSIV